MQIQLSAGSKEQVKIKQPEGKKKGTFGDSSVDVASRVTSEGALARVLSGVTLMKASWRAVQTYS